MKTVEKIKNPIRTEMEIFEKKFYSSMNSRIPLLNKITYYIVNRKGKQMRPMLVFLISKLVSGGLVNERTYRGACIIELIHTATLIHDDVVDESHLRRGFFSLNAIWKNKIAILVGDYLLSKGLLLSIESGDFDLLEVISKAVKEMSEGELLQIEKSRLLDITEPVYFDIIRQKTATLLASCCAMGICSVKPKSDEKEKMYLFGEHIGIAFQIKDDLFDYTENLIGKPTGIDIRDQKMTLPLIYTMNNASKSERKWLINSIKRHNKNKKRVQEVIAFVREKGGLDYAIKKMEEYRDKALQIIEEYPESEYKSSLKMMINYVIERKR